MTNNKVFSVGDICYLSDSNGADKVVLIYSKTEKKLLYLNVYNMYHGSIDLCGYTQTRKLIHIIPAAYSQDHAKNHKAGNFDLYRMSEAILKAAERCDEDA